MSTSFVYNILDGAVGRYHGIIGNGINGGVIVSRDARNATEPSLDTTVTRYASNAARNSDGEEREGILGGGLRKLEMHISGKTTYILWPILSC